jgi:cytochrome c biogenesis protein CcmG/thiol:disulfide interchange protein DsbE
VSKKPTKVQRRAQAVADRQRVAEAAARHRRNRFLLWGGLAVVVVVAVVVAVLAGGGGNNAKATSYETASVKVSGTPLPTYDDTKSPDPAVGEKIPTLQGKSVFDGSPVTIGPSTGKGEPQAVVFVAHWCPHCQREVPLLVSLAKQGVFDGVKVSAVATATNKSADNYPPSAWLKGVDWPFPVMADSSSGTAATAYGLSAFPYFVLVNPDGTVAARGTGELPANQIQADIDALKAGKPIPNSSSSQSSSSG